MILKEGSRKRKPIFINCFYYFLKFEESPAERRSGEIRIFFLPLF